MTRIIWLSLLVLTGCTDYLVERHCLPDDDRQTERAEFVLQCALNANPKSDEEPEDMLNECHRIASSTFCVRSWSVRCSGAGCDGGWKWMACAHASRDAQAACRHNGWDKQPDKFLEW